MLNKITKLFLISIFVFSAASLHAQSSSIENGISYLESTQAPSGYWGGSTEAGYSDIVNTCYIADTLRLLGITDTSYNTAIQWLGNITVTTNNDYLAEDVVALANSGVDTTGLINNLIPSENTDSGWGAGIGFSSDFKRTLLALQALKSVSYSNMGTISNALSYLVINQNTDGGWGFYAGDDSNVYMTGLVSYTLQQFPQSADTANAINNATAYLTAHQNSDGGFGSSPSTVYETAYNNDTGWAKLSLEK